MKQTVFVSSLGIDILGLPIVNAQTIDDEPRSVNTCYSYMNTLLMSQSIFIETNESIFTVILDPEVRKYLIDHCMFYHYRTGIWQDARNDPDSVNDTIIKEFGTKYPAPDILKHFFL